MEAISADTQSDGSGVEKVYLKWNDVYAMIHQNYANCKDNFPTDRPIKIFGIPRGGVYTALSWMAVLPDAVELVDHPEACDMFVDDIIDTGATAKFYNEKYGKPVAAMLATDEATKLLWYVFPWEALQAETGPTENVRRVLEYIGEEPDREGLLETPDRVVRSWEQLYGGYGKDPKAILKVFEEDTSDEMVVLKDIEFYSTCEHHMIPFFGKAHIAYIPNGKVVGISKLARLLEVFARRLQIQERLCQQVTKVLMEELGAKGAACVLEAQHLCMLARGVEKQNSVMVTSSTVGAFRDDPATRAEFMNLIK